MNTVYKHKELNKLNFFQKILKTKLPSNFAIEVNNLLSEKELLNISQNEICEIADRYGKNVFAKSNNILNETYKDYLNHCLIDKQLSETELAELKHLKSILSLTDKNVLEIHNNIVGNIYQKSMNEVVSDGKIDDKEEKFLEKLRKDLNLSEEIANKISDQVRGKFVQDFFDNAVSDERLSPEEEEQFALLCENLNVKTQMDDKIKSKLNRFKLYWVIENGEIPEINVQLSLEKNEKCYFQTSCEWYETRVVTKRINYSGTSASIKIMKGVRYRVGTIKPQRITSEEWKQIDRGTMYLTNKRIIFTGQSKNTNIKLPKILSFTPYSDGIEISKDVGRSPILKFTNNVHICSLILSRLLNE